MPKEVRVPEVCDAIAMNIITYDDPTKKPLRKNEEASFFHPLPALFDLTNESRVRQFLIEVHLNGILSD